MIRRNSENVLLPYFLLTLLSFLLLVLGRQLFFGFVRTPIEYVLIPPKQLIHSISQTIKGNISYLLSQNLQKKVIERDEFKREVDVLKSQVQILEEENNSLRTQLEANLPASWDFIPAKVLGSERYLLIDKGKRDGVAKDMIVISEKIVVGRIYSVSEKSAQVMFLYDPEAKTSAKTDKNTKGLVTGIFGNKILLTKVLQKDPLNEFDLALTSGEDGIFPADLVIGKVGKIAKKPEEIYKEAEINALLEYDKLQNVFVISKY